MTFASYHGDVASCGWRRNGGDYISYISTTTSRTGDFKYEEVVPEKA